ncbi:interleukin-18-binding protein [Echinops telfairi]|uniref:Interleukin-18-binding protein n=1 Tax=Echinops telfairi TaxID=9371 RepID=A0ABM0IVX9_ECHTE|nr:interleukin-18-binding protein [Echinops telfairi]
MSRRHGTPDPGPMWVLLLCAHILHLPDGVTPSSTAAIASAGTTEVAATSRPPTAKRCPALEVTWPEVEVPLNGRLNLSCTGCSHFSHFNLLYWLGNGSFIEHVPGRLWEGNTSRVSSGSSTWLQRSLVLDQLTPALRSTNFSCVLLDPAQLAQRHLLLAQLWIGLKTTQPPTSPGQASTLSQQQESSCGQHLGSTCQATDITS